MEIENQQEIEWNEAQKINISVDLINAAKSQLHFLSAVDNYPCLHQQGSTLDHAIYRYNACWLPLLAKHTDSPISKGPLVVPLDCEWIWHCHRLNPVQYKKDCEELYGKILDNFGVASSVQGLVCKGETKEIWNKLFPDESYEFDVTKALDGDGSKKNSQLEKCTRYDLLSAVKRQSPFYYQEQLLRMLLFAEILTMLVQDSEDNKFEMSFTCHVSRPHMNNDIFLKEAVERYKGFLHLIKRNKEMSLRRFCVPTYDVDLIWHTHQLNPAAYCKDLNETLGKVLEHDDMDSDRTKGKKLDTGFSGTTKQWEDTFGRRYWKAGAMYRGSTPSPLTGVPFLSNVKSTDLAASNDVLKTIQFPEVKVVEVFLEVVAVKNLPEGHKGKLLISFSKTQPDKFLNTQRKLTILSESGEKQVASFQCEPKGELVFELISHSPSNLPVKRAPKTMGTTSLSLQEFLVPVSKLSAEKWVELVPTSGNASANTISLRIAVSFTLPTVAPHIFHLVRSWSLPKSSCLFPLPGKGLSKSRARVVDESHTEVMNLQMRESAQAKSREGSFPTKQVVGITKSDETHTLAEFDGTKWSLMYSDGCLQLQKKAKEEGYVLELAGNRMLKIFPGKKLDYESKHCEHQRTEQDFMTVVEFSAKFPYGKAVALLDLKSEFLKVKEQWFVVPGITLAFILSDILRKGRYNGLIVDGENLKTGSDTEKVNGYAEEGKQKNLTTTLENTMAGLKTEMDAGTAILEKSKTHSGACGGGCGSGCGHAVGSGCGSGCGGGCGNMVKSSGGCGSGCGGGCGSGCGGGCGNILGNGVESGGCGSGCSGGCRGGCGSILENGAESAGCGGCGAGCGGGCGNILGKGAESGGCSGGCGGGCGSALGNGAESAGCGGCGAGCGGGCGNILGKGAESAGCGGCGGSGCGNMNKSGNSKGIAT
ncbi:hypothetical protein ACFE04_016975 [Oxalis oulophora]